jgi:sporulation protein YlmC with PRC-barrel domain
LTPVDEGLPIAYEVLEKGVPVYASDGEQVGTVDHVVCAEREDIFHGVVIRSGSSRCFVEAEQVAAIHERGVDLRIDAATAAELPAPHGAAPAWRVHEPGTKPSRWLQMLDRLSLRDPKRRNWSDDD